MKQQSNAIGMRKRSENKDRQRDGTWGNKTQTNEYHSISSGKLSVDVGVNNSQLTADGEPLKKHIMLIATETVVIFTSWSVYATTKETWNVLHTIFVYTTCCFE